MSTIGDLKRVYRAHHDVQELRGNNPDFNTEYYQRIQELQVMLRAELGVTPTEVTTLPDNTEFGPETDMAFTELVQWLKTQDVIFFKELTPSV